MTRIALLAAGCCLAARGAEPRPPLTMACFGDPVVDRQATFGDTWDAAWTADGRVLLQYNDGSGFGRSRKVESQDGITELLWRPDQPGGIRGRNLNPGPLGGFLGKTYSTGVYELDGALYHLLCYSVQTPGAWRFYNTSLYKSTDGGATWLNHRGERDSYIPNATAEATFPHDRWGQVNFVKYGKGGEAPDCDRAREFAYLACGSDDTWLARIRRTELKAWSGALDRGAFEFFCGKPGADGTVDANWCRDITRATPVRKGGCPAAIIHLPALGRYLTTSFISDGWMKPPVRSTLFVHEAPHPWGPWSEIHREYIEPRVGDNLTWLYLMPAFASQDGRRIWATVTGKPPENYGLQFLPLRLSTAPVSTMDAEKAKLTGLTVADGPEDAGAKRIVKGFSAPGRSAEFVLQLAKAGTWCIRFRYHCSDPDGSVSLSVNGGKAQRIPLGATVESRLPWNDGARMLELPAGRVVVRFAAEAGDRAESLMLARLQWAAFE